MPKIEWEPVNVAKSSDQEGHISGEKNLFIKVKVIWRPKSAYWIVKAQPHWTNLNSELSSVRSVTAVDKMHREQHDGDTEESAVKLAWVGFRNKVEDWMQAQKQIDEDGAAARRMYFHFHI